MPRLDRQREARLVRFTETLIDQQAARVAVAPQQSSSGFWFGGGNLVQDSQGHLLLVGRFRNHGDSRTGLQAGQRGLELAVYRSTDGGDAFDKVLSFDKPRLDVGPHRVLSIEGSALHVTPHGVELFVSTEKSGIAYPDGLQEYLKPGTGVWTIDRLRAADVDGLADAEVTTVLQSEDPRYLHVKDPVVQQNSSGRLTLLFCTHPFCWTSSNTAYTTRAADAESFAVPCFDFFSRGCTWDVAMTRGTALVDVPPYGAFDGQRVTLLFYDGGESLRQLDEHASGVRRARGYSCEELGGVAYCVDGNLHELHRLSVNRPLFVSPWGTGCSRYVDVLRTSDGLHATWQQSQNDQSQLLVINSIDNRDIQKLLE